MYDNLIKRLDPDMSQKERYEIWFSWRDAGVDPDYVKYRHTASDTLFKSYTFASGANELMPTNGIEYVLDVPDDDSVPFDDFTQTVGEWRKLPPFPTDVWTEHPGKTASEIINGDAQVNNPSHYCSHPSGVECKDIVGHYTFFPGAAMKYIWRAGLKGDIIEDYRKAIKCLEFEIERLEEETTND